MRYQTVVVTGLLVASVHAQAILSAAGQALPVKSGRPAVASVAGDAIFLDELLRELGPSADKARLGRGLGTAKELEVLDRLINIKLVAHEAATMGLDEVPEIRKQVEVASREIMREVLFERIVKDVKPDPAAVEKLFRDQVREWKTTALVFQDEKAAQRAQKEITTGTAFDTVAARAVAAKAARTQTDDAFHPKQDFLPQIAEAIAPLGAGQVGPVVRIPSGFVVVKVLEVRYPENPEARAEARKQVLNQQQLVALKAHEQELRRQTVVNTALLKSLDYEAAKPGIDALLKDKRVVAEIKGAAPVTVGDLTDYLRMQLFHGSNQAAQRKKMNEQKGDALDAMVARRLLNMEALKLGIDKTNAYRDRATAYRDSLVFDSFFQKVIVPENKMREEDVRKHYDGHLKEYSSPGMIRMRGLAFAQRTAAEDAMRKLREGADFGWVASNAGGQVGKGAPGLLEFDGRPVTTDSMPAGMQKTLAGAKAGEFKLYVSPEGHVYVLAVQQVIAPSPRPYDEVREDIAKKLYQEKLKKALEGYAGKLRPLAKVETYVKRMQ
ncbi:MAG: peptidyl-prolyl cis-trans isomerase [Vicinamibacterales bacterium]|jgi:hypothetical protein|nr:peptidyl-prolyl cis-trans isomerase [Vicinamibacterales bacterium]